MAVDVPRPVSFASAGARHASTPTHHLPLALTGVHTALARCAFPLRDPQHEHGARPRASLVDGMATLRGADEAVFRILLNGDGKALIRRMTIDAAKSRALLPPGR